MNPTRYKIIAIGAVVFAAIGLYPPWLTVPVSTYYSDGRPEFQVPALQKRTYGFVFAPPEATDWISRPPPFGVDPKRAEEKYHYPNRDMWSVAAQTVVIDWSRLAVQWLSVLALTTGACFAAAKRRNGVIA